MKIRAKELFSKEQKEKIRQAVRAAEGSTRADIAIMLVDESDRYREAELTGALSFSALVALVLSMALHQPTIWFYIPVTAVLLFPFLRLFKVFPHMKLAFLHRRRVEEAVRERAVYAFFQKGVHETDEQTGILIFISLLERKVWILADKGIHGKIADDFLRTLAFDVATGIKEDRALEALCSVIEKCGAELARYFPGAHGKNQPGDEIIC
jgi:putative membrane protein